MLLQPQLNLLQKSGNCDVIVGSLMSWQDAAAIAAVISLVAVVVQIFMQSRQIKAQTRAYIHVGVSKLKEDKLTSVCLQLHNSGKIPARNVLVTFTGGSDWKSLRGNPSLPFEPGGEELHLWPGETVEFRLGPLKNLSTFQDGGLMAQIEYRHSLSKKRIKESAHLTTATKGYVVSRKIR